MCTYAPQNRYRKHEHTISEAAAAPSACKLRRIHCGQSESMEATRAKLVGFNVRPLVNCLQADLHVMLCS